MLVLKENNIRCNKADKNKKIHFNVILWTPSKAEHVFLNHIPKELSCRYKNCINNSHIDMLERYRVKIQRK